MTTTTRPATDPIAAAHRAFTPPGIYRAPRHRAAVQSKAARALEVHAMNKGDQPEKRRRTHLTGGAS